MYRSFTINAQFLIKYRGNLFILLIFLSLISCMSLQLSLGFLGWIIKWKKKNFYHIRTTFVVLLPPRCFCEASNRQRYFSFANCIWTTFMNICDSPFTRSGARFWPVLLINAVITPEQMRWDRSTCRSTWRESVCWKWQKWRKVLSSKHF